MVFLTGESDITPIVNVINNWIHIGQALVGSIGALAFIFPFLCVNNTAAIASH